MCPLGLCDGSGLLPVTDWTGGDFRSCACVYGLARQTMPAEVADRLALVVEGEAKARRRTQEPIHDDSASIRAERGIVLVCAWCHKEDGMHTDMCPTNVIAPWETDQ